MYGSMLPFPRKLDIKNIPLFSNPKALTDRYHIIIYSYVNLKILNRGDEGDDEKRPQHKHDN